MPLGTQPSAGPALARENAALEAEIADLMRMQQARQAASDFAADVAPRFRQAVQQAQLRVRDAERAYDQIKQQTELRIRMKNANDRQARDWLEDALLDPSNELRMANAALSDAELRLGQQIQARRDLRQLESDAPAMRAEAKAAYEQALAAIETRLVGARMRVLD